MLSKLAKISYLFAAVFALSLWSFAAQYETKPQKETKGKNVTVTGCLQKGDQEGEFTLTGSDGRKFSLSSTSSVNLAEHVGHTVTVTGTKTHKEQAGKEHGKAEPGKTEAGKSGPANLQVTDLKMVSATCTASPK
jgi:hypothetical protein